MSYSRTNLIPMFTVRVVTSEDLNPIREPAVSITALTIATVFALVESP